MTKHIATVLDGDVSFFTIMDWIKENECPYLSHRVFIFGIEHTNTLAYPEYSLMTSSICPDDIWATLELTPVETWNEYNGMKYLELPEMFLMFIDGHYYYTTD